MVNYDGYYIVYFSNLLVPAALQYQGDTDEDWDTCKPSDASIHWLFFFAGDSGYQTQDGDSIKQTNSDSQANETWRWANRLVLI